jgi:predicted RNA-binding Zn-ribbon protein involved in translation (DUF1610 family)
MNKKELRKFADPGLKFNPGNGLLHTDKIDVIVRSAVKNIAGRRTLLLYLYDRKSVTEGNNVPRFTVFQHRDDYITLEHIRDGSAKWRVSCRSNLRRNFGHYEQSAFYSQKDATRVTNFCSIPDMEGFYAIDRLQAKIMTTRTTERIKARDRNTIERMKPLQPLPRGFKGWLHREVMPAYIFYKYSRTKKPLSGYCTACGHDVEVLGAKHSESGKCPRCGRSVTFKATGKIYRMEDRVTTQIIQRISNNELVTRIFKVSKNYSGDYRNTETRIWESARYFARPTEHAAAVDSYYYSFGNGILTKWKKGVRPKLFGWGYDYYGDPCGYLYTKNIDDALNGTLWQYSQLKEFYLKDREPMNISMYLYSYAKYPFIEYLVKFGKFRLAEDIIYGNLSGDIVNPLGKNLCEIFGVESEHLSLLQSVDFNGGLLKFIHSLKTQEIRVDESFLRWYFDQDILGGYDVFAALQYTTPHKLMKYIIRQFERVGAEYKARYSKQRNILSEYRDYLELCKNLKYDLKNDFILFPRDLIKSHDDAVKMTRTLKDKVTAKAIRGMYKPLKEKFGFKSGGYTIIAPKTVKDITDEGHSLHHCVGMYTNRIAKGECVILFLRRTDAPKIPFVTVQVKDGSVTQVRGQDNGQITPETEQFLKLWERNIAKKQISGIAA